MGEARRRKLAGIYPACAAPEARKGRRHQPIDWTNPEAGAAMIRMLHAGLLQDDDPTLTGVTLILPDGNAPLYIAKDHAKRRPKGSSDA